MRVRNIPNAEDLLREFPYYVSNPSEYAFQWKTYFQNKNPIHIEIGMGKGQFITTVAQKNFEINYIGIEKSEELILKALNRIKDKIYHNIAFIYLNAQNLKEIFAQGEIERIYLNFSDPWPKKRHEKRRLTHGNFLKLYKEILKKEGEIHFKTDSTELFEFSLREMESQGFFLREVIYDLHKNNCCDYVMTEYEEKFVGEGKTIYQCIAVAQ